MAEMHIRIERAYRRRPDGVVELIPPPRVRLRQVVISAWVAMGGLAVTIAFAAIIASSVRPSNYQRTAGVATVCWNWAAGPSGCWTR